MCVSHTKHYKHSVLGVHLGSQDLKMDLLQFLRQDMIATLLTQVNTIVFSLLIGEHRHILGGEPSTSSWDFECSNI